MLPLNTLTPRHQMTLPLIDIHHYTLHSAQSLVVTNIHLVVSVLENMVAVSVPMLARLIYLSVFIIQVIDSISIVLSSILLGTCLSIFRHDNTQSRLIPKENITWMEYPIGSTVGAWLARSTQANGDLLGALRRGAHDDLLLAVEGLVTVGLRENASKRPLHVASVPEVPGYLERLVWARADVFWLLNTLSLVHLVLVILNVLAV